MLASCSDERVSFADEHRRRARDLLVAALAELDSAGDVPDLGARLQGVIDALEAGAATGPRGYEP